MIVHGLGLGISLALGGLGLFLISVKLLSNGLKQVSGDKLRIILKKFTKTNFHSILFGLIFTTMIQSSDGAVALIISLVAAGFMPLKSALSFVLGANIGTATTSIIVSMSSNFEFTQYFMILSFIGGMALLLFREKSKYNIAIIISSIGLIFIGLKVMGAGMTEVSSQKPFQNFISSVGTNSWLSSIISFIMTGFMQSSSATITVAQGIYDTTTSMTLEGAIGFVIGANIGTTVTAFLTTIGSNKDTKRIALFWLLTNFSTGIIVLAVSKYYAQFINLIQPIELSGHGGYNNFQMSIAHVFFNLALVLIFFPLLKYVTKLVAWIIREDQVTEFKYESNLPVNLIYNSPQLALEAANNSFYTIGNMNLDIFRSLEKLLSTKNKKYLVRTEKLKIAISESRKALYDYLAKLNTLELTEKESSRSMNLVLASRAQERVSELLMLFEEKITEVFDKRSQWFNISPEAYGEIITCLSFVKKVQKRLIDQSREYSRKRYSEIRLVHDELLIFVESSIVNHEKRIKNNTCVSPKMDYHKIMNIFSRISYQQLNAVKYFQKRKNIRTNLKESHSKRLQAIFNAEE